MNNLAAEIAADMATNNRMPDGYNVHTGEFYEVKFQAFREYSPSGWYWRLNVLSVGVFNDSGEFESWLPVDDRKELEYHLSTELASYFNPEP